MMFGLFGLRKNKKCVADLLQEFLIYQQLIGHISKAQSLQKLDRFEEARQIMLDAERIATSYLNKHPNEKKAHMMLLLLHRENDAPDRAEPIIERLLNSNEFQLSDEETGVLSGELQNIRRQRQSRQRTADGPRGFTQVYCCANCGRLHNSVSMPCPHCDWSPQTLEELARSIVLSNSNFQISALLILSREIAKGRVAVDVVPDLLDDGNYYLSDQESRQAIEKVFSSLQQNEHENHRRISMVRACSNCGEGIVVSTAEECEKCGVTVNWPEALRLLACMDNLLWLLERRVELNLLMRFRTWCASWLP
jgi:RNA polymerase subunit RPABC4/transcription elongation factor Spt4